MHYRSPIEVMAMLKDEPDEWLIPHPFIFMHRAKLKKVVVYVYDLRSEWLPIGRDTAEQISEYLKENLCIDVPASKVLQWFSLYPFEAAIFDEIDPFIEESLDAVLDMVSHYYLNSWWPTDSDNITDDAWIELLKKAQAYFKKASEVAIT
jgi:hypothetical protein